MTTSPSPSPPAVWRLRTVALHLSLDNLPLVMGVVNVTPDSFSDGGRFLDAERAVAQGLELVRQGVDILDVGGESTRPYATPVGVEEELRRVLPVITRLREQTSVPLSIDTTKAVVAREALRCGAEIINDVTGLAGDPEMVPLAVASGAGVCVMHMQGTPATMQDNPRYHDVVQEVYDYLRQRRDDLVAAGVDVARLCLDPGIGFGKTHQHNLELLQHCERFVALGCPVLVGPSRKGFIAHVLRDKHGDRTAGTIGVVLALAAQGVQVVRVHDVGPVKQALRLFAAAGGAARRTAPGGR
jgi:dihydropteroate synthase